MSTPEALDRVEAECKAAYMISSTHRQRVESILLAACCHAASDTGKQCVCAITCFVVTTHCLARCECTAKRVLPIQYLVTSVAYIALPCVRPGVTSVTMLTVTPGRTPARYE
jgi:hypothetical protein